MSYLPDIHRLLPQSPDAEKGLLGSILLSPDEVLSECAEHGITPEHFHIPSHGLTFRHCMEMWREGDRLDFITLTQWLKDRNELDACGGAAYITELFTFMPTAANFRQYAEVMREKHIARRLIATCAQSASRCYDEQAEIVTILHECLASVGEIAAPTNKKRRTFKQAVMDKLDRLENDEPDTQAIKTGIAKLDDLSPLRKGSMPLITGARKAGKSTLAITIAKNVLKSKYGVLYFSLEDPENEVIDRLFAGESRIPIIRHTTKLMQENEFSNATNALNSLADLNMIIRDDVYDIDKIVAVSKRAKAENPNLELIVVDYAQLVRANTKKGANREQEVSSVSRALRLMSMELKTATAVLSQQNEDGKSRDSRALEQDATACWEVKPIKDSNNKRLIAIPWQRGGESNIAFPVSYQGHIYRMEDLSEKEERETHYDDQE